MARKDRKDRGLLQLKDRQGWYVRLSHFGKLKQFGPFKNKTEARSFYERSKGQQREQKFDPNAFHARSSPRLRDLLDLHLKTKINHKSYRDHKRYATVWKDLLGELRPADLNRSILLITRERLIESGRLGKRSPATINRHMDWLRHFVNAEVLTRDLLKVNPVKGLPKFKESPGRWKFLSDDEEGKLYDHLAEPFRTWVEIGIKTGMRQSEQFSLTWGQILWDRRLIRLYDTKAGEEQWVILTQRALDLLESLKPWSKCQFVFVHPIDPYKPINGKNFARWHYRNAVKQAGLNHVTWHTLRHTYTSRLAMAGVNEAARQTYGRWKDQRSVKRYSHLSETYLHELLETVSNRDGNRDKKKEKILKDARTSQESPDNQRLKNCGEVAEWPKATVC